MAVQSAAMVWLCIHVFSAVYGLKSMGTMPQQTQQSMNHLHILLDVLYVNSLAPGRFQFNFR